MIFGRRLAAALRRLGRILGAIEAGILLSAVYWLVFCPFSIVRRVCRLRCNRQTGWQPPSFWIPPHWRWDPRRRFWGDDAPERVLMDILGLSFYYHDSAACLYRDGRIVACASEERFTRKKHDEGFPRHAIKFCLAEGGIEPAALDAVCYYELPALKWERLLTTWVDYFPRSFPMYLRAAPIWLKRKLWCRALIRQELDYEGELVCLPHHLAHAASAYYCSAFEEAAVLTADGVGEWATTALAVGNGTKLQLLKEIRFPHSLGLLYSAFTQYLGFKVNSGEYKVMGLAAYGRPRFADRIRRELVQVAEDGSYTLNMKYFGFPYGRQMVNRAFCRLFGGPPRRDGEEVGERHADLAASIQRVTEEIMLGMARYLHQLTRMNHLCLAGGVALNCVANRRLLEEGPFSEIFIQPAAGDAGGAIGAAAYLHHERGGARGQPLHDAYLGPGFATEEIRAFLGGKGSLPPNSSRPP